MMDISKTDTIVQCNLRMKKEEVVVGEDLIMEILLRLPPVSVLKFKSVCKSWYSLISNPSFLRNHARKFHLLQRARRLDPPGLLLSPTCTYPACIKSSVYAILPQDEDQDVDEHSAPPLLKACLDHSLPAFKKCSSSWSTLFDSCNGLLLYYSKHPDSDPKVLNPITNQYTEVPLKELLQTFYKPEELKTTIVSGSPHIVFDPSISLSYKILTCLHCLGTPDSRCELYVYSSDTRSWRLLTSFAEKYGIGLNTFMFDGVFYWLKYDVSICFDFVKESVWFLPLPPIPGEYPNRKVLYFGECGGRLQLIEEYFGYRGNQGRTFPFSFDIMEMEPGSTIWTVKSRVNIEAGYDHLIQKKKKRFPRKSVVRVMHLYETDKGEEAVLLNVDYERLISFNLTTNTFGKEITIPYFENYGCLNAFSFTPTLFPLLA